MSGLVTLAQCTSEEWGIVLEGMSLRDRGFLATLSGKTLEERRAVLYQAELVGVGTETVSTWALMPDDAFQSLAEIIIGDDKLYFEQRIEEIYSKVMEYFEASNLAVAPGPFKAALAILLEGGREEDVRFAIQYHLSNG